MTPDPSRWLVTINGRSPSYGDMCIHGQRQLADKIAIGGIGSPVHAQFAFEDFAIDFRDHASREFPEDDVRLWTSVDPSPKER